MIEYLQRRLLLQYFIGNIFNITVNRLFPTERESI